MFSHLHIHNGMCYLSDKIINDKYFHVWWIKIPKKKKRQYITRTLHFVCSSVYWIKEKSEKNKNRYEWVHLLLSKTNQKFSSNIHTSLGMYPMLHSCEHYKNCAHRQCYPHFRDEETRNQRGLLPTRISKWQNKNTAYPQSPCCFTCMSQHPPQISKRGWPRLRKADCNYL